MTFADLMALTPYAWPLVVALVALFAIWRIQHTINPIIVKVVDGVANQAASNSAAFAIVIGFGLSSSLSAFYDIFMSLDQQAFASISWHQYAAMWCKVLNPFVVTVIAKVTANPFEKPVVSPTP